jgi:predicted DNA binding CopG/RHH family protein
MTKKKLPTGPIRIDLPIQTFSQVAEREKQKQDSGLQEVSLQETIIAESSLQETSFKETSSEEAGLINNDLADAKPIFELNKKFQLDREDDDEEITEYKKVAMRLSVPSAEKLKQLRAITGVPYEILVDVLIDNWENLSQKTQAAYLKQAKQLRMRRLLEGQEKTMKTMKKKYST